MASAESTVTGATERNIAQGDALNNGHGEEKTDDACASPSKKAKIDETGDHEPKRRSAGRPKKNRDEEMMAEAKAMLGELDTSGGRSMRKRPDPPKSEEKKKPVSRRSSKKSLEKSEDKDKADENSSPADTQEKSEPTVNDADKKVEAEEKVNDAEKVPDKTVADTPTVEPTVEPAGAGDNCSVETKPEAAVNNGESVEMKETEKVVVAETNGDAAK
jgi:hypothetical protein